MQNVETKPTPAESKDDVEIILESSNDVSVSPTDSTKTKFEGLKQKVKEALEKNDKEETSDSDTEELGLYYVIFVEILSLFLFIYFMLK